MPLEGRLPLFGKTVEQRFAALPGEHGLFRAGADLVACISQAGQPQLAYIAVRLRVALMAQVRRMASILAHQHVG